MRRIRTALAIGISIALAVPVSSPAALGPAIMAHRGGAGLWPENTMTAFRNAQGLFDAHPDVDGWLEMDTQFTKDHVLVVIHDATLDRTTDCTGAIVDHTGAEVAACDANPGAVSEPPPTLEQVLVEGQANGWRLVVEIKDIPAEPGFDVDCAELADALVALVGSTGFPSGDLIVQSFWPLCLERIEKVAPSIDTLLLTSSTTLNDVLGLDLPVPLGFTLLENALVSTLRGFEYSAPDDGALDLNAVGVLAAHLLGRKVVVWTVDDPIRAAELASFGADGIISNRPDLLM